jgi:glutamate dehydrogenase
MLLGVIEIADRMSLAPAQVARLHFALGERLGLPDLVNRILALPREDRWQTMARAALRDDVYAVHTQLTAQVLRDTSAEETVPARIAEWEDGDSVVVQRAASILQEICQDDNADLARMSVGLRVVRGLLAN